MDEAQRARLEELEQEHERLLELLASAAYDPKRYAEVAKRVAELEAPLREWRAYREAVAEMEEAQQLLRESSSAEDEAFVRETMAGARARAQAAEERLLQLLVPRDPRDDRPVIVEIRAGAGGDEAALFAGDLVRMYQRFAERRGWKTDVLDVSPGAVGGLKEAVLEIDGKGAFSVLRHESGVHRVQRVPATESSGRIHTSTATVAVLPEAERVEVDLKDEDLDIDTYRSQGAGGQHVNTTDSAVRITHRPSGIVVTCQSERSQRQNLDRAMRVLLARLRARAEAEARLQIASERRAQVGTGDRSEKIRTYNFPQNRVTDHRIGLTVHGIQDVMDGDLDEIVGALALAESPVG